MISPQEAKLRARKNWKQWRLLIAGMISYSELDSLDPDDLEEANAALDIHLEEQRKANSRPRK